MTKTNNERDLCSSCDTDIHDEQQALYEDGTIKCMDCVKQEAPDPVLPATNIAALPRYIEILLNPTSTHEEVAAASECLYGLAWVCDGSGGDREALTDPTHMMPDSQNICFSKKAR